jgi:hypothetical protein
VDSPRFNPLSKQPTRWPLTGFGFANQPAASREAAYHRRPDGTLEIEHRIVATLSQRAPQKLDFMVGFLTEWRVSPLSGGGEEHMVDQRPGYHTAKGVLGREQRLPSGLHNPVDDPFRMGQAKGSHRRQCVQDIAHGAQPDNE